MIYEIWIDASCKHVKISKNKYSKLGESTIAVIVKQQNTIVHSFSSFLGMLDNNQAEYMALISAIEYVLKNNIYDVVFYTDSSLLEKQMNNKYSCNSSLLYPYYSKAKKMIKKIKNYSIIWVKRSENKDADFLCNQEYQKKRSEE